jgi:hypothetical protein
MITREPIKLMMTLEPTTIKIFQDCFECPSDKVARSLLSCFSALDVYVRNVCQRCHREAHLPISQFAENYGYPFFQANESEGVDPQSKEADWWVYLLEENHWPFTGWACSQCYHDLHFMER